MMRSIHAQLERQKWFRPVKRDDVGYQYVPMEKAGQHGEHFERYWGDRREAFDGLMELLAPMNTEQTEIVATLYTAWNDVLIRGESVDDELLVNEVLNRWDDAKQRIPPDRWQRAIVWMRNHGLVPQGFGSLTRSRKMRS